MKFQRTAERFLLRLGATTSHWNPDALTELVPQVVPVILLGEDRIDVERSVYSGAPFSPAVALEVSSVSVEGVSRDIEVLSAIASVTGATRIGLLTNKSMETTLLGALTPPAMMLVAECEGPLCSAQPTSGTRVLRGNQAGWGAAGGLLVPANIVVELAPRPVIVPNGVRLVVALQDVNIGVSCHFTWRELGG